MLKEADRKKDAQAPDFVVETSSDIQAVKATANVILPGKTMLFYLISSIVLLLIAALILVTSDGFSLYAVLFAVVGALGFLMRQNLRKQALEQQLALFRKSYGADSVPLQLLFQPGQLEVNDRRSGGGLKLPYKNITRIQRFGDYLAVCAKGEPPVALPAADLTAQPRLLPYFLAKCPNARKKGL